MAKYRLLFFLFVFSQLSLWAQHEADNWFFGSNAGLNFNTGSPVPLLGGALNTEEGCATISDSSGNLLFYTNGQFVYDINNNLMPNGSGLHGDQSSTQSAIIVPKPGDLNIYYIFTVEDQNGAGHGLEYSAVDMTLNGGLGDVVTTEKNISLITNTAEKVTAVKTDDCSSIFVITYKDGTFYTFNVSTTGVNTTPVQTSTGFYNSNDNRGYLKANPQGDKIALAHTGDNRVFVYDLNPTTGQITNEQEFFLNDPTHPNNNTATQPYGVEFSPNSEKLYISSYDPLGDDYNTPNNSWIWQFDLLNATPQNSSLIIYYQANNGYRGGLQLGPDFKIYHALSTSYNLGINKLSVINSPELLGTACDYQYGVIDLGGQNSRQGLPPFIQSIFSTSLDIIHLVDLNTNELNLCTGNTFTLFADNTSYPAGVTYEWTKDGVVIPVTTNSLTIDDTGSYGTGTYELTVDFNDGSCPQIGNAIVTYFQQPVANPVADWFVCDFDNDGFNTFDLSSLNATVLNGQIPTDFTITYHPSQQDADDNTNALPLTYTNTVAYQLETIFVRIENNANTPCYDTTSFNIDVMDTPTAHPLPTMELCDSDTTGTDTDGIESFNLSNQNATLLDTQDPLQYTITYHSSQADADANTNALSIPYENTSSPNQQTIFVRIENNDNPDCYDTTSFDIIVHPKPVIESNPVNLEQCDDDTDGFVSFNLHEVDQLISTDYANETFTFYESLTDAQTQTNPIATPTNYINPGQPISNVWAEITTVYGCSRIKEFTLTVGASQIPSDFIRSFSDCDNLQTDNDDTNGIISFDFSSVDAEIRALFANPLNIQVTYYRNITDALAEENPIADISDYRNEGYPNHQWITVRVDSDDLNGCMGLGEHIELTVNPLPVMPQNITDFEECSTTPNTFDFDLTQKDTEILNGQTGVTISYYETLIDAEQATNPITGIHTNTTNPQTIYVRLEDNTTGCYRANGQFDLVVNETPFINTITDFELCDDNTDGIMSFLLSDKNTEILAGQTDIAVTYYLTATDADTATNALSDPFTNTSNPQTIYVRLENNTTHCSNTGSFNLVVNAAPNIVPPTPLEVCDPDSDGFEFFDLTLKDSEIAGTLIGTVNVTYYETQTDAELGTTPIPTTNNYQNIDAWSQTIYVRVETITTGCFDTVPLELIVHPTPQINFTPDDVILCDDSTPDGFTQVDLEQTIPNILGGVPLGDVQVSFYHTQIDAQTELNPIVNATAYTNTVNPETIWVRVEYPLTNCASVVSFDIIVNALPIVSTPTPLELCDNIDDGEDSNGVVQTFMLTDKDAEILNGQAATVSYHFTQAEAISGSNPISSPFENTVPNVQTLWVRVEFENNGCFNITTLDVRVNPLPTPLTPAPVEACDADANGFADFELDAALIAEIQNGEAGVTITFHETYTDAENNDNALTSPYASIVSGTQTIYARDTYDATGCYRIVEVTLIANPAPQPTQPSDYEVCDDDNDGIAQFDLAGKDSEILGSIDPATVNLTYHLTLADAQVGANPIDTTVAFTNTSNPQTIYVRLADILTDCYNVVSFDLIVNPLPVINLPPPLEVCDDDYDGFAEFDLESSNTDIVGTQTGVIVYYFETLAQAITGDLADRLISPYTNTSNPQTIHVRVEDLNTGCFALTTLDLRVLPIPLANLTPDPLELCDNDDDGDATNGIVQTFDLSLAIADILNGQLNTSLVFYETLTGAENQDPGDVLDPTVPYENTSNPQTVYAVVTDNASALNCTALVSLELIVNPLPVLDDTFTDYQFCEAGTNGIYDADLSEMDIFLLADPNELPNMTITYYLDANDAAVPVNPLPDSYVVQTGDSFFARVEYTATGCFVVSQEISITVNQAPEAIDPPDMVLCDDDTDGDSSNGFTSFDLGSQSSIIHTQGTASVTYYADANDAILAENALGNTYTNTSNPQTIYVRVEDNATHCTNFVDFEISVNDPPHFTLDTDRVICIGEGSIFLEVYPDDPAAAYTYVWTDNQAVELGYNATLEVSQAGQYTVTIGTGDCSESQTVNVIASEESTLASSDLIITDFAGNNTIQIPTGFGIGNYEYSLDGGTYTPNLTYENLTGGEHHLDIRDLNGCNAHQITFIIVDYMRFFTPNGDGYNDTWQLLGFQTQPNAKIHIFDRFGKLLAKIDPNGPGWDGKFNGYKLPSTDYWFSIELSDGRIKKGHFSLVRR